MYIPIVLAELQIANEDLMIDFCSIGTRTEEMNTVQVGDVDTPGREKHVLFYIYSVYTYMYMYKCFVQIVHYLFYIIKSLNKSNSGKVRQSLHNYNMYTVH